MARINVEYEWFTDPRRTALARLVGGSTREADGLALEAWRIAQEYWAKGRRLVPTRIFQLIEGHQHLITVDLARAENDDFIYVKGSAEHHEWRMQLIEGGVRGGRERARRATRNDEGIFQASSRPHPGLSSAPSPSPSPSQKELNTIAQKTASPAARFDFESLYQKYPRKEGKQRGLKICQTQIKTQEDYDALRSAIDRYCWHLRTHVDDAQFIKHFSTFMGIWRDWTDPAAGTTELPGTKVLAPINVFNKNEAS